MERWQALQDYHGYSVSDLGRARRDSDNTVLSVSQNHSGHALISMRINRYQMKRSLGVLVAREFVAWDRPEFTTPIHLDDDPLNCAASNLRWRPRWFAIKYARQFDNGFTDSRPVRNINTGQTYTNIWEVVFSEGVLAHDVFLGILNETQVFPLMQRFVWAEA